MPQDIIIPIGDSYDLAELLGILYGDGYMNHYKKYHYLIEIAGHSEKDFLYHRDHLRLLFKRLFNLDIHLRIRKDQNTLYTYISSKKIFEYLEEKGMVRGKKNNLSVPYWIKNNDNMFISFTRGLYDTDGSVILRKRGQHSISFSSKNKVLVLQVKKFLEEKRFFISYTEEIINDKRGFVSNAYCIRINQKAMILKFIEEVGSSNPYKVSRMNKIKNGDAGI